MWRPAPGRSASRCTTPRSPTTWAWTSSSPRYGTEMRMLAMIGLFTGFALQAQTTTADKRTVDAPGRPSVEVVQAAVHIASPADIPQVPKLAVPATGLTGTPRQVAVVEVTMDAVPLRPGDAVPVVAKSTTGEGLRPVTRVEAPPVEVQRIPSRNAPPAPIAPK